MAGSISKVDVVGVPSSDSERSREFYVETLGLRPAEYQPQANSIALLRVDDVEVARAELEAKGVTFHGETYDSGVCHMAHFTDRTEIR